MQLCIVSTRIVYLNQFSLYTVAILIKLWHLFSCRQTNLSSFLGNLFFTQTQPDYTPSIGLDSNRMLSSKKYKLSSKSVRSSKMHLSRCPFTAHFLIYRIFSNLIIITVIISRKFLILR